MYVSCMINILAFYQLTKRKLLIEWTMVFLFSALNAFGFGEDFTAWVGLLYSEATCMVKVGGGLSRPITISRGIRQGCPISGQLYSIAIKPFLCTLRNGLTGLSLPGLSPTPPVVSAYADYIF